MADHSETEEIAGRMKSSTRKLHELSSLVGSARQIREFNSDQRKAALSTEVVKFLKSGESATAAEHMGRASEPYQAKLAVLAKQLESAESTIASWSAEMASFEAARSLLSFSKETMRQLDG
jgi:hypothetical protein